MTSWPRRRSSVRFILAVTVLTGGCATTVSRDELAREYFNLGNAFYELGRLDESYAYYTRALELDATLPPASFNLARLLADRGQFGDADAVLVGMLESDPENVLVREMRAWIAFQSGDTALARDRYAELAGEVPGNARLAENLARVEFALGSVAAARSALAPALTREATPELRWFAAELAYADNDEAAVREQLEFFRQDVETDGDELMRLARRLDEWGFSLAAYDVLETIPTEFTLEQEVFRARMEVRAFDDVEAAIESLRLVLLRIGTVPESERSELLSPALSVLTAEETAILESELADLGVTLPAGSDDAADSSSNVPDESPATAPPSAP